MVITLYSLSKRIFPFQVDITWLWLPRKRPGVTYRCAFIRDELGCVVTPWSAFTHRGSFYTMDRLFPSNSLWLLSIISLLLLIFVIGERNCAGMSDRLTKGGLSHIVILNNSFFPWTSSTAPSPWTPLIGHMAPGENPPHDSNNPPSMTPGRLGSSTKQFLKWSGEWIQQSECWQEVEIQADLLSWDTKHIIGNAWCFCSLIIFYFESISQWKVAFPFYYQDECVNNTQQHKPDCSGEGKKRDKQ